MTHTKKNRFDLQYKLCMHPKEVTEMDMYVAFLLLRDFEQEVDQQQRLLISYREEIRKLTMENQWLTQQLQESDNE